MDLYPKVRSVSPRGRTWLLVTFENGVRKAYDCEPLMRSAPFAALKKSWLFKTVQVDPGGYGVRWNDEIDLSESELWMNGQETEDAAIPRTR